jgi:hypothetical protein
MAKQYNLIKIFLQVSYMIIDEGMIDLPFEDDPFRTQNCKVHDKVFSAESDHQTIQ